MAKGDVRREVEVLVDRLKAGQMETKEMVELLSHPTSTIRANTLEAIARRGQAGESVVEVLAAAAADSKNRTLILMGTVSVAHVAMAALLKVGSSEARLLAGGLLAAWPEPDRSDLLWYLNSEKLWPHQPRDSETSPST